MVPSLMLVPLAVSEELKQTHTLTQRQTELRFILEYFNTIIFYRILYEIFHQ